MSEKAGLEAREAAKKLLDDVIGYETASLVDTAHVITALCRIRDEARALVIEEAGSYLQSVADEQTALGKRLQQAGGYSLDDIQACFVCARHYRDAAMEVRALKPPAEKEIQL